jgi:predicted nucleotide-binding protein
VLQVSAPIAQELLARYLKQGHALVERATLVGDFSDYEAWKAERKQWNEQTARALGHIYASSEEADEFRVVASPAEGGQRWQQQYVSDLACVEAASETLGGYQRKLGPVPVLAADSQPDERSASAAEPADELQAASASEPAPGSQDADELRTPEPSQADEKPELSAVPEPAEEPVAQAWPGGSAELVEPELELEPVPEPDPDAQPEPEPEPASSGSRAGEQPARLDERVPEGAPEPLVGLDAAPEPVMGLELAPASANGAERAREPSNGEIAVPEHMRQVFLAHGRDEKWMNAVSRLLAHSGPHTVTVLNERPSDRRALAAQFEGQVAGSHYAVVLLTADDVGAPRLQSDEEPYYSPRARQGVIFEMGFLVAALSPSCVCVLYEDGVEMPCDLDGISYIRLDYAGTWQSKLLLQLRKAGFNYDMNKLAPV